MCPLISLLPGSPWVFIHSLDTSEPRSCPRALKGCERKPQLLLSGSPLGSRQSEADGATIEEALGGTRTASPAGIGRRWSSPGVAEGVRTRSARGRRGEGDRTWKGLARPGHSWCRASAVSGPPEGVLRCCPELRCPSFLHPLGSLLFVHEQKQGLEPFRANSTMAALNVGVLLQKGQQMLQML